MLAGTTAFRSTIAHPKMTQISVPQQPSAGGIRLGELDVRL